MPTMRRGLPPNIKPPGGGACCVRGEEEEGGMREAVGRELCPVNSGYETGLARGRGGEYNLKFFILKHLQYFKQSRERGKTMSNLKVHVLRLTSGQEVKTALEEYVRREAPRGVILLTCCGSVTSATLRLAADAQGVTSKVETYRRHFEVVSMSGTICSGGTHLHVCLSDHEGRTLGGHVVGGLTVFTTMEVALGEPTDLTLGREFDSSTSFTELTVTRDQAGRGPAPPTQ